MALSGQSRDKDTMRRQLAHFRDTLARIAKRRCERGCCDIARHALKVTTYSPAAHFRNCRPMCDHVELCPNCYPTICPAHEHDPDSGYRWRDGEEPTTP